MPLFQRSREAAKAKGETRDTGIDDSARADQRIRLRTEWHRIDRRGRGWIDFKRYHNRNKQFDNGQHSRWWARQQCRKRRRGCEQYHESVRQQLPQPAPGRGRAKRRWRPALMAGEKPRLEAGFFAV